MAEPIIRVENLGKKYRIRHEGVGRYQTFRDVLVGWGRSLGRRLRHPFTHVIHADEEEFWALRDVSFAVREGEVLGVIGRNGAGKSTLLKVLSRITEPTTGRVTLHGRVASLLEVGTGFHPELTGRENVFLNGSILGMTRAEIRRKIDEIVAFAEIETFLDTPVKRYSSGMYMRLAFAVAAHLEPQILVIDEVLAVGDVAFQRKCLGKMQDVARAGRTVLFVSHNVGAIDRLCTQAIYLEKGRICPTDGVAAAIKAYLHSASGGEIKFTGKPLLWARVRQVGERLEVEAEYQVSEALAVPNLGFVISDQLGNPVFGSNLIVDPPAQPVAPSCRGMVRAIVEQPKLVNGTYRVSLWFGDGKQDMMEERDCLSVEVVNMARPLPPHLSGIGPVRPSLEWHVEPGA